MNGGAMGGIFGGIIGSLVVAYVLPRVLKLPAGYQTAGPSKEDLEYELGSTFRAAEIKGYVLAAVIAALWCGIIVLLKVLVSSGSVPVGTVFVSRPETIAWILPMMFGGMGLLVCIGPILAMRFLREDSENYVRYHNLKSNYRVRSFSSFLFAIMATFSVVMTAFLVDCRTIADSKGITLNPMFSFGATQQSWRDVDRLIYSRGMIAPNGKAVARNIWQIRFKGGDVWSSDHAPGKHPDTEYSQLVAYASQRSRVKPEAFALLQDADK